MKKLFTLMITALISLSLMGQQDIRELKKERYNKKHQSGVTALEKKKSKNPEYASRHISRKASELRSTSLKAVTATDQKMDSLHWELYDAGSSEWVLSDRELFAYDDKGNMITYVWFAYDSVEMEILPFDKQTVKHDDQGNPTEIIWQIWDAESGQWLNWRYWEMSYDENGNLIQETISDWDPVGGQWLVGVQYDMAYDGSGNILEEIWWFWDEESSMLVQSWKDEYLYEEGNLTTWNEYFMIEDEWVLIYQTTYTYDTKGNLTDEFTSYWDSDSEMFYDESQVIYTYNEADQLIKEETWEYNYTYFTLIQSWQFEYTWDSDGNLIEQVDMSWELGAAKGTNVWLNQFKSEWSFNKDYTILDLYVPYWFNQSLDDINFVHMPVSELGYIYLGEEWVYDYRQTAYYSDFGASTGIGNVNKSDVRIFPIPASETLTFKWDDSYSRLSLELYDLTGKRVISRSISNNETLGVEHLSGGIYLYKLTDKDNLIHSGKISVE